MGADLYLPLIYGNHSSSERFCIEFLLFVTSVPLSDPLPGLGAIVEGGLRLGLSSQDGRETHIQLVPVFCGARNPQVGLLNRERQVLIVTVQISLCFIRIPSLLD